MQTKHSETFGISYPFKFSKLFKGVHAGASLIAFLLLTGACSSNNSKQTGTGADTAKSESPDVDIKVKKLSEQEVIQKVQYVTSQQQRKITLQLPYSDWETTKVPCSQIDVDMDPNKNDEFLCKCKPKGGGIGAPYGYKTINQMVTKCCKPKEISVNSSNGKWTAVYSEKEEKWAVEFEVSAEDIKKVLLWIVGDKDGEVRETGENPASTTNTVVAADTSVKK